MDKCKYCNREIIIKGERYSEYCIKCDFHEWLKEKKNWDNENIR